MFLTVDKSIICRKKEYRCKSSNLIKKKCVFILLFPDHSFYRIFSFFKSSSSLSLPFLVPLITFIFKQCNKTISLLSLFYMFIHFFLHPFLTLFLIHIYISVLASVVRLIYFSLFSSSDTIIYISFFSYTLLFIFFHFFNSFLSSSLIFSSLIKETINIFRFIIFFFRFFLLFLLFSFVSSISLKIDFMYDIKVLESPSSTLPYYEY